MRELASRLTKDLPTIAIRLAGRYWRIALLTALGLLLTVSDRPSAEVRQARAHALSQHLLASDSPELHAFAGSRLLVSPFFLYSREPDEPGAWLLAALEEAGALLIKDDRPRVESADPSHASNLKYAEDRQIQYILTGSPAQRPGMQMQSRPARLLFRESRLHLAFRAVGTQGFATQEVHLTVSGYRRWHPAVIWLAALCLAAALDGPRRRQGSWKQGLDPAFVATGFGWGLAALAMSPVPGSSLILAPLLFLTILAVWRRLNRPSLRRRAATIVLLVPFLLVLTARGDIAKVVSMAILLLFVSPRAVDLMEKVPGLNRIVKRYRTLQRFYFEHRQRLESLSPLELVRQLATGDLTVIEDLRLFLKWALSQAPLAIGAHLIQELLQPDLFYLLRTEHGGMLLGLTLLFSVVAGAGKALLGVLALGYLVVRPVMILQVAAKPPQPVDPTTDRRKSSALSAILFIASGIALLVGYSAPAFHASHLLLYFDLAPSLAGETGAISLAEVAARSRLGFGLTLLWYVLFICLIASALVHLAIGRSEGRNEPPGNRLLRWGDRALALPQALALAVANVIAALATVGVLVLLLVFPLRIGFPPVLGWGVIALEVGGLLCLLAQEGTERSQLEKGVGWFATGVVALVLVLGVARTVRAIESTTDQFREERRTFPGYERALGELISTSLGLGPSEAICPANRCRVPAGPYISGEQGHWGYRDSASSGSPGGRWRSIEAFAMDATEVTNAAYGEFLSWVDQGGGHRYCHPSEPSGKDHAPQRFGQTSLLPEQWRIDPSEIGTYPVVGVDWYDAYAYCAWKGGMLPSPEQWEKALRGVNGKHWPWGHVRLHEPWANTDSGDEPDTFQFLAPVRSFPGDRSIFGIYDLAGNVSEWCSLGPFHDSLRQPLRGFAWDTRIVLSEAPGTHQERRSKEARSLSIGFRCAYPATARKAAGPSTPTTRSSASPPPPSTAPATCGPATTGNPPPSSTRCRETRAATAS